MIENKVRLPLNDFIKADDLMAFFAERLKVQVREKGVRHDVVDAIFALGDEDDLVQSLDLGSLFRYADRYDAEFRASFERGYIVWNASTGATPSAVVSAGMAFQSSSTYS